MGEYAEMMINGEVCQGCGVPLQEELGYPGYCQSCWFEQRRKGKAAKHQKGKAVKAPKEGPTDAAG